MKYKYISASETGLKRARNEDSVGVFDVPTGLLVIVCDGVGGNNAGEVASGLSVETIHSNFIGSELNDHLEKIKGAIINANHLINEKSKNNIDFLGMATTVELLFLNKDSAYWGHVGDSRIYIWKNGKLKQITKDHSLVQKLIDEGHLTLKEAEKHPNRNIVMRALGDKAVVDIDLSKQKLNAKDELKFFVCTDGVTEVITNDEIEELLMLKDLGQISETLKSKIEERGAPDNYSFVIIEKIGQWSEQ